MVIGYDFRISNLGIIFVKVIIFWAQSVHLLLKNLIFDLIEYSCWVLIKEDAGEIIHFSL